jgi:hypothetical protein
LVNQIFLCSDRPRQDKRQEHLGESVLTPKQINHLRTVQLQSGTRSYRYRGSRVKTCCSGE